MLQKRLSVLLVGALMLALSAAPALAQGPPENPGVETGPDNANSECSFSGLNDNPDEGFPFGGQTQSYGQLVSKLVKVPGAPHPNSDDGRAAPGFGCNGNLAPLQEDR
jgi:hypothetical protein